MPGLLTQLGWVVAGAALEQSALALPEFGFLSAGCVAALGAAVLTTNALTGGVVGLLGLGLRTVTRARPRRWLECWSDLAPLAGGLLLTAGLQLWPSLYWEGRPLPLPIQAAAAVQVYLALAFALRGRLTRDLPDLEWQSWRLAWARARPYLGLFAWFTVVVVLALPASPWNLAWLLPLLGLLHAQAAHAVRGSVSDMGRFLQRRLGRLEQGLEETRTQLTAKSDEFNCLQFLARNLAGARTVDACLNAVMGAVQGYMPVSSVVVFVVQPDGQLEPRAFRSPQREQLAGWRLHPNREPLVETAFRQEETLTSQPANYAPVVFRDEPYAVACPLGRLGVLYAGRAGQPFGGLETRLLGIMADQAAAALGSAYWHETRARELDLSQQHSATLTAWLDSLDRLLALSQALSGCLDPLSLAATLGEGLSNLVPGERKILWVRQEFLLNQPPDGLDFTPLLAQVVANGRPLLLEEVGSSRFAAYASACASLLCVPHGEGALLVGSQRPGAYSRREQHLLQLLSVQLGNLLGNAELHHRTREALEQLQVSRAQLVESSKMAAVGQLAAGVSHEVNTPLCAAMLRLEMARGPKRPPDKVAEDLQQAHQDLGRVLEVVEKLLFYSRDARAGRVRVDLKGLVEDTRLLIGAQLESAGVELRLDLEPAQVMGNSNELQQVLINLLLNARDALDGEPGWVRVTLRPGVRLSVDDSGPGVPPGLEERIFEPFFTTHELGSGVGLGLSVAQQIAQSHRGRLHLEGGCRFVLTLPGEGDDGPDSDS